MISVDDIKVSWNIFLTWKHLKISNIVHLWRFNIALIPSTIAKSSLPRHRSIHTSSMQLITACRKSDIPSRPWFGKPLSSNKLLDNKKYLILPITFFILMLLPGIVLSIAIILNKFHCISALYFCFYSFF